jgi:hypothetical protein
VGTPLCGQLGHISLPQAQKIDSLVPMCTNLRATFQNYSLSCSICFLSRSIFSGTASHVMLHCSPFHIIHFPFIATSLLTRRKKKTTPKSFYSPQKPIFLSLNVFSSYLNILEIKILNTRISQLCKWISPKI